MNVVLPVKDGKVFLFRGSDGYLRPAMGEANAATVAERSFGAHGFTDLLGKVHFSGKTFEFHRMDIKQIIQSTKTSQAPVVEVPMPELINAVKGEVILNIFLDLGVRMYCELVA
ncbi:UNVERIFIED_CONTAM: hypothetical protein RF648_21035 [Kocuria sp. CPCC 205274]